MLQQRHLVLAFALTASMPSSAQETSAASGLLRHLQYMQSQLADPPDPDNALFAPERVSHVAFEIASLEPMWHPDVSAYRVPAPPNGRLQIGLHRSDRNVQVSVDGRPFNGGELTVRPGQTLTFEVSAGTLLVRRYLMNVIPGAMNLQQPSLYLAGGNGVRRIRLLDDQQSTLPLPIVGKSFMLAAHDATRRLYASVDGPDQRDGGSGDALVAFDLRNQQTVSYKMLNSNSAVGPVVVAPGGQPIHVAALNMPVLGSFDGNLTATGISYLGTHDWAIQMPIQLAYRPGTLDLYASDLFDQYQPTGSDVAHLYLRRTQLDLQTGTLSSTISSLSMPKSQTNTDGDSAAGMGFLPSMGLLVVANSRGDELVVVDQSSGLPLARKSTGAMPFYVAVDPDATSEQGRVFVSELQSDALSVYRIDRSSSGGVAITSEARLSPCHQGHPVKPVFGSDPATLYLLCTDGVTVLDADSLAVKRHIAVSGGHDTDMVWSAY